MLFLPPLLDRMVARRVRRQVASAATVVVAPGRGSPVPLNEHVPTTSEPSVMKAADTSWALRWLRFQRTGPRQARATPDRRCGQNPRFCGRRPSGAVSCDARAVIVCGIGDDSRTSRTVRAVSPCLARRGDARRLAYFRLA